MLLLCQSFWSSNVNFLLLILLRNTGRGRTTKLKNFHSGNKVNGVVTSHKIQSEKRVSPGNILKTFSTIQITMSSLFCCPSLQPYRPQKLDHEAKFHNFMAWACFPQAASQGSSNGNEANLDAPKAPYAVQLVRQVNYGPLESKRYFIPLEGMDEEFTEISEGDLIQANFQKLNS